MSVIIPAYNASPSLGRSLNSALSQKGVSHEVTVINDGSTDATAAVAKSYGGKVHYIEQPNLGQGAARNKGLLASTGEFVAFLDADDYWLPNFLVTCTEFLKANPEVVAVSTGRIVKTWRRTDLIWCGPSVANHVNGSVGYVIDNFFDFWGEHDHIRTGTNMIRRQTIDRAGYQRHDLRISQDLEYWGYIGTFGSWGFIPEPLWVGDPVSAVVDRTWLNKYYTRRKQCPTVEQWESRIVPRLTKRDWPGYRKARGRVAAGYLQTHVLNREDDRALEIFRKYGSDMTDTKLTNMVRIASRYGRVGWKSACELIRLHEQQKSIRLYWQQRHHHRIRPKGCRV